MDISAVPPISKATREYKRAYARQWGAANPEKVRDNKRRYTARHHDRLRASTRAKASAYNRRIRMEALELYGNKCVCCGEAQTEFLAFDHINGLNGRPRIRSIQLYSYLRRERPSDVQILCHNCNVAKSHWGQCPHKR